MRELTCIVCPIGCSLSVEEGPAGADGVPVLSVTGNRCPRGVVYAQGEIRSPTRVVTATCGIVYPSSGVNGSTNGDANFSRSLTAPRRLPVKSSAPCPKGKINELLEDIYRLKVQLPVKTGEKLITNWKGLGLDVVAVRSLE